MPVFVRFWFLVEKMASSGKTGDVQAPTDMQQDLEAYEVAAARRDADLNTFLTNMEAFGTTLQSSKENLEQAVADLQSTLDARDGEIEQLQKGQKQAIDTLNTKHQTSLAAQYETVTQQEQAKYAADLSAATAKHSTELALVKSSIATDIQAARKNERQLQQAAFDTRLNTALQEQASTKQAEFDTKLAADLQKMEAELNASHASKLTAALEEQRKSLQAQFDADIREALENQRLEMETKHRNKMDLARARWGKRPAPVSNSSASNVETSTTGSSSLGLVAVGDASAIDASTVAIVDAAPVTETSPPNNALPDIRLDTLPQRKSPPKRPAPAPETNDQASRRSKRSRVSNSTSEPETSVSRSAVPNANDMANSLWEMFKIDGLSEEESTSLRATVAARLFTSGAHTLDSVIEQVDKYVTGRFDSEPPFPGPCFLATITSRKKGPGGPGMTQNNCPHCVEHAGLVCCYATYVEGVAEAFPARVNGQVKKKDRVWLKDAQPRTVESDGRQVRWVLHKR